MKPTLPTPIHTTDNDRVMYFMINTLWKLDLAEIGDDYSVYKWLTGED